MQCKLIHDHWCWSVLYDMIEQASVEVIDLDSGRLDLLNCVLNQS